MSVTKFFLLLGAINALLAVLFGAIGAHGIRERMTPEMVAIYQTGVQYHWYHALGLLIVGIVMTYFPASSLLKWAGWLMFTGILLFSGSLYASSLTSLRWFASITPIGGIALILSWACMIIAFIRA